MKNNNKSYPDIKYNVNIAIVSAITSYTRIYMS